MYLNTAIFKFYLQYVIRNYECFSFRHYLHRVSKRKPIQRDGLVTLGHTAIKVTTRNEGAV